jgi:hypothetical protein
VDLILTVDNDKIWRPGSRKIMDLTKVPKSFKKALLKQFTTFMAVEYTRLLRKAITSQRFKDSWEPLTEKYLAWKERMGYSKKIWEATKLL